MPTEIASLGLEVQSDQVAEANLQLRAMPAAASAAERAVQKWGLATDAATDSNENFSKRVRKVVTDLEFQRQQLARNTAEQEKFAAVRRAGVTAESAAGQAITASVTALQSQRSAQQAVAESTRLAQQQAAGFAALATQQAAESARVADQQARQQKQQADQQATLAAQRQATVQGVVTDLEFHRAQLTRNAAEQEKYTALRRAGVSAASAEGQAISASVAALQAQRSAMAQNVTVGGEMASMASQLRAAFVALGAAWAIDKIVSFHSETVRTVGALHDQADAVGLNTDALQAYLAAARGAGASTETAQAMLARFNVTLGEAKAGNDEAAKAFIRLKVPILDGSGAVRDNTTLLTEASRALIDVKDTAERAAIAQVLFSRNGAQATPVMREWAKGTDAVVASMRAAGQIVDSETIDTFNRLARQSDESRVKIMNLYAQIAAPIQAAGLSWIARQFQEIANSIALINTHRGLFDQVMEIINVIGLGGGGAIAGQSATERALRGIADAEGEVVQQRKNLTTMLETNKSMGPDWFKPEDIEAQKKAIAAAEDNLSAAQTIFMKWKAGQQKPAAGGSAPQVGAIDDEVKLWSGYGAGSRFATPKGQADSWEKIIAQAKAYVAQKQVEAQAVGLSADAAARMTHEQELLNKATEAKLTLGPKQLEQIKQLAAAMADADAALKTAKFMDDARKSSDQFIANQKVEADTLFMSSEAASAYRHEQEMLNKAANDNIVLTDLQKQKIHEYAGAMAEAEQRTSDLKEIVGALREGWVGFFTDFNQGLAQGKSVIDAFGNAMLNMLNRVANKLIDMAAQKLFDQAFGGSSGGGGFLGGIFSSIGRALGIGGSSGGQSVGAIYNGPYAHGAVFNAGNVVPFARGGIVTRPTLFPMANGMGLMGEAGYEGVLPLRRGRNGRLGVEAGGMGGGVVIPVTIVNNAPAKVSEKRSIGPNGTPRIDLLIEPLDAALASKIDRGEGPTARVLAAKGAIPR